MKNIIKYAVFGGLCFIVAAGQGCSDDEPAPNPTTTVTSSSSSAGGGNEGGAGGGSEGGGEEGGAGGEAPGNTYQTLATVLANDWLIVNLDGPDDSQGYLGVEAQLLGGDMSTGGRLLGDDVVDTSYQALTGHATIGDGIDEPQAPPVGEFPYMPYMPAAN